MNTSPVWIKDNINNKGLYTWDSSIGNYGGFIYNNSNNIVNEEIKLENIGEIQECLSNIEYPHINECIGISNTTIDLNYIPKNSKYGWDYKNNCWVYYLNNNIKPSYFAKKLENV